ncbi:MAG: hypothetical protein KF773_40980 [Deltaproteobacteria bacterium]|nr:hypothetical protein [Deltaproteobacteria bacterium]
MAFFLVVACGKGNSAEPPPPPTPQTPKAPVDGIEVVNQGSEPRRLLRYVPKKGSVTRFELASDGDFSSPGRTMRLPTLVLTTEVTVDDVLPDGSAKIRQTIVGATVRERKDTTMSVAQLADLIQAFNGVTIASTLAPNGSVSGSVVDAGKNIPKAMADHLDSIGKNFEQSAMALPDVPVGVGAVYRFRKTIAQIGIPSTTVTTIEVTAIDGDRVSFRTTTKATGADQKVKAEDGSEVDVRGIGGGGSGSGTYDLARVVMNGDATSDFHVVMNGNEVKMASLAKMTVKE